MWGYCQFRFCPEIDYSSRNDRENDINQDKERQIKRRQDEVQKLNIDDNQKCLWHYPSPIVRQILALPSVSNDNVKVLTDPYEDADLFVVVRNPYDRIISLYYHWECFHHPIDKINSVGLMNRLVGEMLDEAKNDYFYRCGHYIPQYDFVYDTTLTRKIQIGTGNSSSTSTSIGTGKLYKEKSNMKYHDDTEDGQNKKVVKHIIHFENLREEFHGLMKQYNINITLPDRASARRKRSEKATITKYDLNAENRQRIENFYAKDFEEFGYPIMTKTRNQ